MLQYGTISYGLQIEFVSIPMLTAPPPPNKVKGDLHLEIIEAEISVFFGKPAIEEVQENRVHQ